MQERRPEFFILTLNEEKDGLEQLVISGQENKRIFLSSIHASYNVDGTNGLLQIFKGKKNDLLWQGRTMGGHLSMTMIPPLVVEAGESLILDLSSKSGIKSYLSVTGYYLE